MKIYTKTGDDGTTSLFDGTRVPKNDPRVDAYGDIDELNAFLGIVVTSVKDKETRALLLKIQRDLFALGAQMANPTRRKQKAKADFPADKITYLEKAIDVCVDQLPPITEFMLPGGSFPSALLEGARTICRRAERKLVSLSKSENLDSTLLIYLNRLSDLLFMMARIENKKAGTADIPWKE